MKSNAFLLVAVLAASGAAAQEFTETVDVRLAEVEVVVTDSRGNPVTGLGPEDFTLRIDGTEQPVTNFQEVRSGVSVPLTTPGEAPTESAAAVVPPRVIALFLDPLSVRTRDRDALYASLREMVDDLGVGSRFFLSHWDRGGMTTFGPTENAQLVQAAIAAIEKRDRLPEGSFGTDDSVDFIRIADEFAAQAGRLPGGGQVPLPPPPPVGIEIRESEIERQVGWSRDSCAENFLKEMKRKSDALVGLVDTLAAMDGRKALVYLSSRFPRNTETYCLSSSSQSSWTRGAGSEFDTSELLQAVEKAANTAGVTFYAIRPEQQRNELQLERSISQSIYEFDLPQVGSNDQVGFMNETSALSSLTEPTGGLLGTGARAGELYSKIKSDLTNYYSLGFRLQGGVDAGVPVEVAVQGRNQVRVRRSIGSVPAEIRIREDLKAALFVPSGPGDIPFTLKRLEPRTGGDGLVIAPLEVSIPMSALAYRDVEGRSLARLRVLSVERAGGSEGTISEISEQKLEIQQPPDVPGVSPSFMVRIPAVTHPRGKIVAVSVVDSATGARSIQRAWIAPRDPDPSVPTWKTLGDIAHDARRPLLLYVRPASCGSACAQVDGMVATEDARSTDVLLSSITPDGLPRELGWADNQVGLVLLRSDGIPIATWTAIPNPLAGMVDVVSRLASVIAQASILARSGETGEADFLAGAVAMDLGENEEAVALLEKAKQEAGSGPLAEKADIRLAFLSSSDPAEQIRLVEAVANRARDGEAKAEAWLMLGALRSLLGDVAGTRAALQSAMRAAPRNSPLRERAKTLLDQL